MPTSRRGVSRISVSLPPDLLDLFDEFSHRAGHVDRSKALQAAMRNFISEHEISGGGRGGGSVAGVVVIIYDHHARGVDEALTEIGHHRSQVINSATHVHLDPLNCLYVIVVKGSVSEIGELEREIRRQRGVSQVRASYLAVHPQR